MKVKCKGYKKKHKSFFFLAENVLDYGDSLDCMPELVYLIRQNLWKPVKCDFLLLTSKNNFKVGKTKIEICFI